MATKTSVLTAPYDPRTGSLLHFPGDGRQFDHYEDPETGERLEREQIWEQVGEYEPSGPFPRMERQVRKFKMIYTEPDWRPNVPFRATMILDSMRSGRSAKYVIWQQHESDQRDEAVGPYFPMFITDLLVVAEGGIGRGGIVIADWMIAKRGQNYGLKLAP